MLAFYFSALLIGLASSLHCIGMCGPIVLSLPVHEKEGREVANKIVYNTGRIFSYFALGLVLGALGMSIHLIGLQQYISIFIGLVILLYVVGFRSFFKVFEHSKLKDRLLKHSSTLYKNISSAGYSTYFILGMLNGLLPCGVVYIALIAAAASTSVLQGGFYMLFFGFGTFPIMLFLSLAKSRFSFSFGQWWRKLSQGLMIIVAILFLLRGLNLGIPMISPALQDGSNGCVVSCCHAK